VDLGTKAKDELTGFEGTLTASVQYLTGSDRYEITALVDGAVQREWFDVERVLEVAKESVD